MTLEKKLVVQGGKSYRYWVMRWVDPQTGKRRSKSIGKMKDVLARTAKIQRDLFQSQLFASPGRRSRGFTLQTFTDQYLANRVAEGKATGTILLEKRAIALLVAHFTPSKTIDEISKADARAFWTALLDGSLLHVNTSTRPAGMGIETAKKYTRIIRTMFNQAEDDSLIIVNPFRVLKNLKGSAKDWQYVSMLDFWLLYEHARFDIQQMIAIARMTSLSRSDIIGLKWATIDMDRREIKTTRQKTQILQQIPICDELLEMLHAWRAQSPSATHVIRQDVYVGNLGRDIKALCKRSGVPVYTDPLHGLRKSCITDWASIHPPHVIRVWAGHADIKTTLGYYTTMRDEDMDRGKQPFFTPKITPKTKNTGNQKNRKVFT